MSLTVLIRDFKVYMLNLEDLKIYVLLLSISKIVYSVIHKHGHIWRTFKYYKI